MTRTLTSCLCTLLLALGLAGWGCERQAPPPAMEEVLEAEVPDHESWQTGFYVSENGLPRMHIDASYMAKYEREDSTYMLLTGPTDRTGERVTVHLFDAEGDSSATLVADRVYYYEQERRFVAEGGVVVETRTGRRLETEDLTWNEAERKVRAPGFVRITTAHEEVQGYRLEADEDLATYRLERVTGQREVKDT